MRKVLLGGFAAFSISLALLLVSIPGKTQNVDGANGSGNLTFNGIISGPTAAAGTSTTQFATTQFVMNAGGGITALRRTSTWIADGTTTTIDFAGDVVLVTGAPTSAAVGISLQNGVGISYAPTGTGAAYGISGNLNYNSVKNPSWTVA